MLGPAEEAEADDHPLAGVLDRLMSRERGARAPQSAAPSVSARPRADEASRRMLVVAGLGPDSGRAALLAVARWGVAGGRKVSIVDFDPSPVSAGAERLAGDEVRPRVAVPLAALPCGMSALRREDPGTVAAVAERLRRHELVSDLLLVRVAGRDRQALARAAFVARGLIVPLDGGDGTVHAAFRLSRELAEALPGISILPFAADGAALDLFATMVRDFLGVPVSPIGTDAPGKEEVLDSLAAPPAEGFLGALLSDAIATAPPCPRLLEMGTLEV